MANSDYKEEEFLQLLSANDEKAIEWLFNKHYADLCKRSYKILSDEHIVEDLVQEVFYEIWKKRAKIKINTSIQAYLRRAARNKTLNYIRDQKIDFRSAPPKEDLKSTNIPVIQTLMADDLQIEIDQAIDSLPEKCRLVFVLSRFEELTYQEIADQLGISIKTVENQISKALKSLRSALSPYLSVFVLVLDWFIAN